MKLLDFFLKKTIAVPDIPPSEEPCQGNLDISEKGFQFLITGDISVSLEHYDEVMTPNTFTWSKLQKNNWTYYQVGEDEFSYSWEDPGIQMTFNKKIAFEKAKKIADEVIENLIASGKKVQLVVLVQPKIYRFE